MKRSEINKEQLLLGLQHADVVKISAGTQEVFYGKLLGL